MKDIWKYIAICLVVLLVGTTAVSMYHQSRLKDRIIELQEQEPVILEKQVHDTITIDSVQVKWRTKHDTAEFVIRDTFMVADTCYIMQTEQCPIDTFSVIENISDTNINATINIQGRGVYNKTFIDSIDLEYRFIQQQVMPKKCCWLKKLFNKCN